jgi:hypothetical protein
MSKDVELLTHYAYYILASIYVGGLKDMPTLGNNVCYCNGVLHATKCPFMLNYSIVLYLNVITTYFRLHNLVYFKLKFIWVIKIAEGILNNKTIAYLIFLSSFTA